VCLQLYDERFNSQEAEKFLKEHENPRRYKSSTTVLFIIARNRNRWIKALKLMKRPSLSRRGFFQQVFLKPGNFCSVPANLFSERKNA